MALIALSSLLHDLVVVTLVLDIGTDISRDKSHMI